MGIADTSALDFIKKLADLIPKKVVELEFDGLRIDPIP